MMKLFFVGNCSERIVNAAEKYGHSHTMKSKWFASLTNCDFKKCDDYFECACIPDVVLYWIFLQQNNFIIRRRKILRLYVE